MASLDAPGSPVLDLGVEEQLDGEPLTARDFVLTGTSAGDPDYQIGSLEFDQFAGINCSVICIAVLDNKLLVAVPQEVWSRTLSQRLLGLKGLIKPSLCSVAAKPVGAAEGEADVAINCKLWVGFLGGGLEEAITFPPELEVSFGFGPSDGPPLVPVKGALLEMANDHFIFQSAESGAGLGTSAEETGLQGRMKFLEDSLIQIQQSLAGLSLAPPTGGVPGPSAGGLPDGAGSLSVRPTSKAKPTKTGSKPTMAKGALSGMDPAVVHAALSAGVPEKHLLEMARVLKQKPSTMDDAPRAKRKTAWTPLEESEEEEEEEAADGKEQERSGEGPHQADTNLFDAGGAEAEERRLGTSSRRIWIGKLFRYEQCSFSPEKRRCTSSDAESFERKSQIRLPSHRSKPTQRLSCTAYISRRAFWDCHSERMVDFKVADPKFHLPREVELASWRSVGCSVSRGSRRSSCEVCGADSSSRSSCHRLRKLGPCERQPSGRTTAVPSLCKPFRPEHPRASAFEPFGPEMGRGLPWTRQGTGQLSRVEEEASKRRFQRRQGERRPRRCWRSKTKEEPEGQESGCGGESRLDRKLNGSNYEEQRDEAGPLCPEGVTTSQLNSMPPMLTTLKVPGASAKTYSGKGVLSSTLRYLMKSRCRLGGFARSFVRLHFAGTQSVETVSRGAIFPMDLPYPEVCRKDSSEDRKRGAEKRSINAVVIVLNYLYFNRPRDAKGLLSHRGLNRRQWEAIDRFKLFLEAWIKVSPTGPEEMGRSAGKFETLEHTLTQLELKAHSLSLSEQSYFQKREEVMKSGCSSADGGTIVSWCPSSDFSTFKQVDPERISFVGRPKFKAEKFLDPLGKDVFLKPLQCRNDPDSYEGKVPRVKVHCSLSQKVRLFELLDASQRLHLWLPHEVDLRYGAGMFCVVKSLAKDRLILDSRPGNLLEQPLSRWIRSLAAGDCLLRLVLRPGKRLVASGNDVRDFYHLFAVSRERSKRNCLVGTLDSRRLGHLSCMRPELQGAGRIVGSLATLAMGDSQAVELAQTCHLSMALSYGICTEEELITYKKPLPRSETLVGILIDDFISIAAVAEDRDCEAEPSKAAEKAEAMQSAYKTEDLIPHEEKAFRDSGEASFWGIDLEGSRGVLRGSIRRAVPLCNIVLQIAALGFSTVDLLRIVSGALISLLLYRRRMLCLLDSIFESCRSREGREVVQLSGKCRSELLSVAVLLPLAASNLRAPISGVVVATDASNWGQVAVSARVPTRVAEELYRHCLRKSVWTRLLGPHAEWLKRHDCLDPDEELPGEEKFDMHPLWAICAQSLEYNLMFAKKDSTAKHINISELRGFLKAEAVSGKQRPSHRTLYGMDSQVCLGAITKGRSSSKARNRELCQALAMLLFSDSYSEAMYFDTKKKRADAPTRGREIPKPDVDLPNWWDDVANGEYATLDLWLKENGLDDANVGDLPRFEELKKPLGREPKDAFRGAGIPALSSPTSQVETKRRTGGSGSKDSEEPTMPKRRGPGKTPRRKVREEPKPRISLDRSASLSAEVRRRLALFQRSQFVGLETGAWPPTEPGHLDLFSGERGVAKNNDKLRSGWTLCFDIEHSPLEDLCNKELREELLWLVNHGAFVSVGGGPVCSSFSTAITPPIRSLDEPYGKKSLSGEMLEKVETGNEMSIWFFSFLRRALELHLTCWIENPGGSWMFKLPEFLKLLSDFDTFLPWLVDYCRFGTKWRKRTKIFSNTALGGMKTLCKCPKDKKHLLLRGRSKADRMNWTRVAQAYPRGVSKAISFAIGLNTGRASSTGKFNIASCARCDGQRIGEASNPGPRWKNRNREGVLSDFALVEPKTEMLQNKIWESFIVWLRKLLSKGAAQSVLVQPMLAVLFLQEYGNELYSNGGSLFTYRHLVVFAQKHLLVAKPFMSPLWDQISRWELKEPTVHRTPLPVAIFRAMVAVS